MSYRAELAAALDAVSRAARLCRNVQSELVDASTLEKKDRSPVTVADFGAQAVVSSVLQEAFPNDPMVGEESSEELRAQPNLLDVTAKHVNSELPDADEAAVLSAIDRCSDQGGANGRRWVLDPIDGTKGYLRRGQYAIALAMLEDGVVKLGVLGCPSLESSSGDEGCLFFATRGGGTHEHTLGRDGSTAVAVATTSDPAEANFCESVESGHSNHARHERIAEVLGITRESYRIDSQCKYAAVSRGQASIYLRLPTSATYQEKIWDHAAGSIVVEEAGGKVTDIEGRDLDFSLGRTLLRNRGIIATNGLLHDRVIDAVRTTSGS